MIMNKYISALFSYALFFLACSVCLSNGHQFRVGGKSGWTLNPRESYTTWANRNRFQINDTLYFKYDNNKDSVLVVDKDNYNSCNTTNPRQILQGGKSVFKFDRSGPFFFITGNVTNCEKGQKLIVVVLAVRSPPHGPSPGSVSVPPVSAPSPSQVWPPGKSGGVAVVVRPWTVVVSAVCFMLGLSLISG